MTTLQSAQNLNYPIIHTSPCFVLPSCNLPYLPSLILNALKKPAKLSFSRTLETLLPRLCCQFGSNKLFYIFSRGLDISHADSNNGLYVLISYRAVCVAGYNFMCQLDWATGCPDVWLNITSGYVFEGFWKRSAFALVDGVKQTAPANVGAHYAIR